MIWQESNKLFLDFSKIVYEIFSFNKLIYKYKLNNSSINSISINSIINTFIRQNHSKKMNF